MILAALLLSGTVLASATGSAHSDFNFKIAVRQDGVYSFTFAELAYQGAEPDSSMLGLFEQGVEVPIRVDDGGDGRFGDGDSITFSGRHLEGSHSWFNEHSAHNIYRLALKETEGLRMETGDLAGEPALQPPRILRHFEQEKLRVALPAAGDKEPREAWYWKRLSHMDGRPFRLELDLDEVAAPVTIRAGLAGLSRDVNASEANLPQHRVDLSLNGRVIGSGEWNGQDAIVITATDLDPGLLGDGVAVLEISVPRREPPGASSPLIDVVLLNWIEVEHPHSDRVTGPTVPDRSGERFLLLDDEVLSPAWIVPDLPSSLSGTDAQADYLIIAHASLMTAIEPLAAYHRRNGLNVALVDVEDIYDEFNHGVQSPRAIRDFIRHASNGWRSPAPRFVLLVGDASWDVHNPESVRRNLVPTLRVQAHEELAASDNGFVAIDGDDWRPDLAIGRLPATGAEELSIIADKIIRYSEASTVGPWRRNIAWITDRSSHFQDISNQLAQEMSLSGYAANRVYPSSGEAETMHDQQALKQAFNNGQLLVHFLGHGGRYVWRTGPPDYRDSSDLFSIADIESLDPGNKLPLVLSMTCSSGPFDHPSADSIAETFLRLPDRGAIGVLAASWRIPASQDFSKALALELTQTGATIGEAVMRAKQRQGNRALVESYNLLGDPALSLSVPQTRLSLQFAELDSVIRLTSGSDLNDFKGGRVIVDWLDSGGLRLKTVESAVSDGALGFDYPLDSGQARPAAAVVYIWHQDSGRDGLGSINISN